MSSTDHTGYALRDGRLQFIADVPSGLACGCTCACCGKTLIAKKGAIRQHHFAHYDNSICHGAAESALHLLAKELLAELTALELPAYHYSRRRRLHSGRMVQHEAVITEAVTLPIHRVRIEQHAGDFIPDVVIESGANLLIIEVAVTHKVDRVKLRKLRRRNLPAVEIQLDVSDALRPREMLRDRLQQALVGKTWLFHPQQRVAERTFAAMVRKELAAARQRRALPPPALLPRSPTPRPAAGIPAPQSNWREHNRVGEQFNRRHGRYPSIEECQRYWPHLYPKKREE